MSRNTDADELFARLLGDRDVVQFLAADFAHIQSMKNRELLYGLLAQILLYAEAREWSTLASRCSHPLSDIIRHASEVEPKTYAPDERLKQPSQVLRGAARIVNLIQAGRPWHACDVVEHFDWPEVRQVVAYGLLRFWRVWGVPDEEDETRRLTSLLRVSEGSES